MYPSTITLYSPTTSTETTKLAISPLESSYVTQNEFPTTITYLMDNFRENEIIIMTDFKESVKTIIADHDSKIDYKAEEDPYPM